jgi:predicted GNAT family acetyltransferase
MGRMRADDWHLTEETENPADIEDFLDRAGDFLRSRPALHTTQLSMLEKWRAQGPDAPGSEARVLGRLEERGEVRAVLFHRRASRRLMLTSLSPEQADALATLWARLGRPLAGVTADHETAAAFAAAWQRHTGAEPTVRVRLHLYRLGTLTPPEPFPEGRGRLVGEREHEHLMDWCRAFAADVGEEVTINAGTWVGTRFAEKRYTYWETADGTPVSMAGANPPAGGQVRIDPVYTPAHLRGRGYGAAVTVEVSRAAQAAGAEEVVLYTNAANPTSNALYRRLGYRRVTDFLAYDFTPAGPVG